MANTPDKTRRSRLAVFGAVGAMSAGLVSILAFTNLLDGAIPSGFAQEVRARLPEKHADAPNASARSSAQDESRQVKRVLSMLSVEDTRALDSTTRALARAKPVPALAVIVRDRDVAMHVRMRALQVLGNIGSRDARQAVLITLAETQEPIYTDMDGLFHHLQMTLLRCIERESEDELLADLTHGDSRVRSFAAQELGKRKSERAVGTLVQLLRDRELKAAVAATAALGQIRNREAIEGLIEVAENKRDSSARASAVTSLGRIRTPECIRALKAIGPDDPEYERAQQTAVMRAEVLTEHAATFSLQFVWHAPPGKTKPHHSTLVLAAPAAKLPANGLAARLSEKEAVALIDHLFASKYLEWARLFPGVEATSRESLDGYFSFEVQADGAVHFARRVLADDRSCAATLTTLRELVNRDAATQIDKLLAELPKARW